jgi:hypothetical protein
MLFAPCDFLSSLRALNHPLCPETSSAGGEGISEAILFVPFAPLTASANRAGREVEVLYSLAEGNIFRIIPQFPEASFF